MFPCVGHGLRLVELRGKELLLAVCARAGLDARHALAPDNPMPGSAVLMFSLAADDIMIFSDAGPGATRPATIRVEREMLRAGIAKHAAKDGNDRLDAACVGVELVSGAWWWPPAARLWQCALAVTHLGESQVGSPPGGTISSTDQN